MTKTINREMDIEDLAAQVHAAIGLLTKRG